MTAVPTVDEQLSQFGHAARIGSSTLRSEHRRCPLSLPPPIAPHRGAFSRGGPPRTDRAVRSSDLFGLSHTSVG